MTDKPLTTADLGPERERSARRPSRYRGGHERRPGGTLRAVLPNDQADRFTTRWQEIQAGFVDEPRESVEQADALVADLMQQLASGFAEERKQLESQWDEGDDASTEDLRVALTRYRSFFERLLMA